MASGGGSFNLWLEKKKNVIRINAKMFFLCYNMYIVSGTTAFPVISTFATPVPGTIRSHFSNFFQQILGSEKRHCFHSFLTSSSNWELHIQYT